MPQEVNDIGWYVFSVSYKKELDIRDELLVRGFDAYVPMHHVLQTVHGRKVRRHLPSVYGLVFARGSKDDLLSFREASPLKQYIFLKSNRLGDGSLRYVRIRDDEMGNFRKLNEVEEAKLTFYKPEELRLEKGGLVKIMDGPFAGITGIVQKLPHKHGQYLVVNLPDVAIAAVSLKPEYIRPLSGKVAKSTDVEKDSKRLAFLALEIIANDSIRDKSAILDEISQIEQSLHGCKVFLPNDKANFHFAFYASAIATGKPSAGHKENLEKVLPRLKGNNLLLPTAHLLFFHDTKDDAEWQIANGMIGKWDNTKFTDGQRRIMRLRRMLGYGHKHTDNGAPSQ